MTLTRGVTDDQLGQFHRRIRAIEARLGRSLDYETVMGELQRIHDGQNIFNPATYFTTRPGLYVWSGFVDLILSVANPVVGPNASLEWRNLSCDADGYRIRKELGGGCVFEDTSEFCVILAGMLDIQWDGTTSGLLLTEGHANIFFVRGLDDRVYVVFAYRTADTQEWTIDAYERVDSCRWDAGDRAFSRNRKG